MVSPPFAYSEVAGVSFARTQSNNRNRRGGFHSHPCKVNRKKVLNKAVENMKSYDPESFLKNQ